MTAFEVTGGVPWRHIRYDNLSPAVAKVLAGRNRTENARWLSFRSWYGFERVLLRAGRWRALMRRAAWRARSAGTGGAAWCRSRGCASLAELNARLAED